MKYPILTGILFTLLTVTANAQSSTGSKPRIFAAFPATVTCSEQELSKAFSTTVDQTVSLSFSNNLLFNGTVTGNIVKYSNLQTVTIKLPEFDNVIFSISKITNDDKTVTYVGRIINKKYADGYELKKDASNNYQFIKFETERLIPECSQ